MVHPSFNQTLIRFCPQEINLYIVNLTSSYTEKSNEPSMVSASVIMFVLAGLFFNLNLFSGVSDVSAILDPKVRLFLTSALSLFLPVMSYLFSEAKNKGATTTVTDLSLRAGLILAWMLLIELLRKKVDEIRMRGYSGSVQRAGRVVWLGNLVFFNIRSAGRKAVFSILWILCATKVLQRIAFTEVGKRSYAHGKNARLISSYMSQMLLEKKQQPAGNGSRQEQQATTAAGQDLLKACEYIVMGEEKLGDIIKPTADGYKKLGQNDTIVTVGKVWQLDDSDKFSSPEQKMICLSFALFKLLRRRFEHLPAVTTEEARYSRDLIFKGLYNNKSQEEATSSAKDVFQVLNDEINFLSEYYHSVVPVVLASPFFLFVNYFLVNIVVAVLCFMTVILCGNGDVRYALNSLGADNYTLKAGVAKIAICLLLNATNSPSAFFSIVDLSITVLLFIIFFYEEIWEIVVFLLSNWFMVSLLYNHINTPSWSTFLGGLFWRGFSLIMWLRTKMSHADLRMKQFSVFNLRWPLKLPLLPTFTSMAVKTVPVPSSVKESIMKYIDQDLKEETPPTNGKSSLRKYNPFLELEWACMSDSVSEVILTWHIATSILEVKCPPSGNKEQEASTAMKLSKYCAYLVAFHPELLPDNPDKTERVFDAMKAELKTMLGCRQYFLLSQNKRVDKIMEAAEKKQKEEEATRRQKNIQVETPSQQPIPENRSLPRASKFAECFRSGTHSEPADAGRQSDESKVVLNGAKLGKFLVEKQAHGETAWKVLADVWTELIIYVAPSNEEERVKGHEDVLVQGGEFITVLWALTTHIGVTRSPTNKPADDAQQVPEGTNKPAATTAIGASTSKPMAIIDIKD